jgi:hypothetical protein
MSNPWISLWLQAARLGLRAQEAMITEFFGLASGHDFDLSQPAPVPDEPITAKGTSEPVVPVETAPTGEAAGVPQKRQKTRRDRGPHK